LSCSSIPLLCTFGRGPSSEQCSYISRTLVHANFSRTRLSTQADPLAPQYTWIVAKPYLSQITLGSCSIVTMRPLLTVEASSHPKHHGNVYTIRHLQVPFGPCNLFYAMLQSCSLSIGLDQPGIVRHHYFSFAHSNIHTMLYTARLSCTCGFNTIPGIQSLAGTALVSEIAIPSQPSAMAYTMYIKILWPENATALPKWVQSGSRGIGLVVAFHPHYVSLTRGHEHQPPRYIADRPPKGGSKSLPHTTRIPQDV
jgi:hypothetical protein